MEWLLGILLGVLYVAAIVVMRHRSGMFIDELDHFSQISLFLRGQFRILTGLTTIPGYHAIAAIIMRALGADSLDAARMVNAAAGLLAAAGFHALRRALWPGTETLATAQFLVLPILVPLFFLIYTDVPALALLLWATLATLHDRHRLSAALLVVLMGVRQHEVMWAGFLAILGAWPLWAEHGWKAWRSMMARAVPYLLPVIGFLVFWWWNGSISLSRHEAAIHPDFGLHAGNMCFALLLAGMLLPLHVIAGLSDFIAAARRRPWLVLVPILVFAGFWWGFRADNPYNALFPWYYVRNAFLLAIDADPGLRAVMGAVVALTVCGLAFTRLRPAGAIWLYPFAAFFLAASWLIEQRYALVPLVLWLAFREHRGRVIESATAALWLVLAVCIFSGIVAGRFFL
jgi:alpha-1,2-glucosyltransferase